MAPQFHRQKREKNGAGGVGGVRGVSGVGGDRTAYAAHGILAGTKGLGTVEFRSADYFHCPPIDRNYLQTSAAQLTKNLRRGLRGSWLADLNLDTTACAKRPF